MYVHTYFSFFLYLMQKNWNYARESYTHLINHSRYSIWVMGYIDICLPNLFKEVFSDMVFSNVSVILQKHFGKSNFFPY